MATVESNVLHPSTPIHKDCEKTERKSIYLCRASGSWKIHELNFEIFNQVGRVRSKTMSNPLLPLSWTIVHPLDKDSPLYMYASFYILNFEIANRS